MYHRSWRGMPSRVQSQLRVCVQALRHVVVCQGRQDAEGVAEDCLCYARCCAVGNDGEAATFGFADGARFLEEDGYFCLFRRRFVFFSFPTNPNQP